jgi:hexosaminidase
MIAIVLCVIVACGAAQYQPPALWPWPQRVAFLQSDVSIDGASFAISTTPQSAVDGVLTRAMQRYAALLFRDQADPLPFPSASPVLPGVRVTVLQIVPLQQDADESYHLHVPVDGSPANLTANTVWGALHGFETLAQLIRVNGAHAAAAGAAISDYPRFAFRGMLHDTARHFLPVPTLLKLVDAMAMNKLNVFHWHLTDDQSFPFVSTTFPNLARDGAFAYPSHAYQVADVQRVVDYARDRGVRVMPEFDSPGHSTSWGAAYPNLLTNCYDGNGQPNGETGPLDVIENGTYQFVAKLFQEVTARFNETLVHIGGDEVPFGCWQSNPKIQAFMAAQGWTDYSKLESMYVGRVLQDIAQSASHKIPVVWQEVFDNGVKISPQTVVDVWKNHPLSWQFELAEVTYYGQRAILSAPWYLNYEDDEYSTNDIWTYYAVEPTAFLGTAAMKRLLIGGEACMWGEWTDATNTIPRTWPRASPVAERLWSAVDITDVDFAAARLQSWTCRMIVRGIAAQPSDGPSFCPVEWSG